MKRLAAFLLVTAVGCARPAFDTQDHVVREGDAAKGEHALLAGNYGESFFRESAFQNLWKVWGLPSRPADFDEQVRRRYGLHPAPYPNHGLPMGLRRIEGRGGEAGLVWDCLLCHGSSIGGRSYIGLGNTTLDMEALNDDLLAADKASNWRVPFDLCTVRGLNQADALAVYLLSLRDHDLSISLIRLFTHTNPDLGWSALPQTDTPPWWNWKAKRWLYYDGAIDARSHSSQTFLLLSLFRGPTGGDLRPEYENWRDVRSYIRERIQAPRYPRAIDAARAARGAALYASARTRCAECHGRFEGDPPRLAEYATPITRLEELGTDARRYEGMSDAFIDRYNATAWFASAYKARRKSERPRGYVAPPLTGVWATAPYLHNGSVPTLLDLLGAPDARPRRYYRLPATDFDAYDFDKVGWKVVDCARDPCRPERLPYPRMIYDTAAPGFASGGHTFGVDLSADETGDLLEFLKSL